MKIKFYSFIPSLLIYKTTIKHYLLRNKMGSIKVEYQRKTYKSKIYKFKRGKKN
jgi:hypothetical protein